MGNLIKRLRKGEDCSMNTETTTPEGDAISRALQRAYLAGFNAAGEGYNGEYPFSDSGRCPSSDEDWITGRDMVIEKLIAALPSPQNGESELRTDGPERIWAWEGDGQDGWENAYATVSHVSKGQVEYIRADLAHEAVNGAATPAPVEAGLDDVTLGLLCCLRDACAHLSMESDCLKSGIEIFETDGMTSMLSDAPEDAHTVARINELEGVIGAAVVAIRAAEQRARAQSAPVGGEVKG